MKKMKKILAMLLALTMVLGMSLTSMATENKYSDAIRVYGVEDESGVTVHAYQIITYNANGYYEEVLEDTIDSTDSGELTPTADNVAELALRTEELQSVVELSKNSDYYTGTLTAGTWMVIVKGSSNYLYNPAIVSVEQGPNGLVYGELNLVTDSWTDELYVKKSQPDVTKTAEEVTTNDAVNGVQYGDIIKYTIEFEVPSYTPAVSNMSLTITDTLDDAKLVDVADATVAVDTEEDLYVSALVEGVLEENATTFTFEISDKEWLLAHAEETVSIVYYAQVTAAENKKVDELTNTVVYTYTTNDGTVERTADTIHYTFSIDGEFVKVGEEDTTLLDGAKFQLHIGTQDGTLFSDSNGNTTFTTSNGGKLVIRGLDSDTVYYLVETKAPTGYTLNATPVKVEFNAVFDEDGYESHTVEFDDVVKTDASPLKFANTRLVALPSTGGIGTTIFTVAGCGIMIAAAYFFFASRKKENN